MTYYEEKSKKEKNKRVTLDGEQLYILAVWNVDIFLFFIAALLSLFGDRDSLLEEFEMQ